MFILESNAQCTYICQRTPASAADIGNHGSDFRLFQYAVCVIAQQLSRGGQFGACRKLNTKIELPLIGFRKELFLNISEEEKGSGNDNGDRNQNEILSAYIQAQYRNVLIYMGYITIYHYN